jgi:hypothetical protein
MAMRHNMHRQHLVAAHPTLATAQVATPAYTVMEATASIFTVGNIRTTATSVADRCELSGYCWCSGCANGHGDDTVTSHCFTHGNRCHLSC